MSDRCSVQSCTGTAVGSVEERALCRKHFLAISYRRLEVIAAQMHQPQFDHAGAEAARRFLEDCIRYAADVACSPVVPDNLEKAQLLDILMWAAELHGYVRRGPRVPARIPILVRSEAPEKIWEEQTETVVLSRHGLQLVCRHELDVDDLLTCIRQDNGRRIEARVVWTRRKGSGEQEAGLEFSSEGSFWDLGSSGAATAHKT